MSQDQPKQPEQESKQYKRTHEKPLSLYPLSFTQAVGKLIKAKPAKPKKKSRPSKPQH
jgi:hypothetical protein